MDRNESIIPSQMARNRTRCQTNSDWDGFDSEAMPFLSDLKRTANWLTRNREDAEDLVQETLFHAMRSFHRYQRGTNCRAWLMTIMHNLNFKRVGKINRMKYVDDPDGSVVNELTYVPSPSEEKLDIRILAGLKNLPDCFRMAVVLSDVYEFSYKEISSALNVPIGTVMSRISRGRRFLRKELSGFFNNQAH